MQAEMRRRRAGVEGSVRTAAVRERVSTLAEDLVRERGGRPLVVLDLGGGTGGMAVPLAQAGHHVTVIDPSPDALAALDRRVGEAGVADRVRAVQGDAAGLPTIAAGVVPGGLGAVDLLCCHGVLEFVDDLVGTVTGFAQVIAPDGVVSLVAAQRLAAVLGRALAGRFAQAQQALLSADGRWGEHDPMPRRFDEAQLRNLLSAAGFDIVEAQGVRLFGDLVPSEFLDTEADRVALLELERRVTEHPQYAFLGQIGAVLHLLATPGRG